MATITITCNHCGASSTDDLEHVMEWGKRHNETCPKRPTEATS